MYTAHGDEVSYMMRDDVAMALLIVFMVLDKVMF